MRRLGRFARFYLNTFVEAYTGFQSVSERAAFAVANVPLVLGALAPNYRWAAVAAGYLVLPPAVLLGLGLGVLTVRLLWVNYQRFTEQAGMEHMMAALLAVGNARKDGVQILARPVASEAAFTAWRADREEWISKVAGMLERTHRDDAVLRFLNLGVLPDQQFPHAAPLLHATNNADLYHDFTRLLRMTARQLEILSDISEELRTSIPLSARLAFSSEAESEAPLALPQTAEDAAKPALPSASIKND